MRSKGKTYASADEKLGGLEYIPRSG